MEDSQQGLTATQVRAAGIEDWRQILGQIKARFRTGDFATGLALVNTIGEAAEAANPSPRHHPHLHRRHRRSAQPRRARHHRPRHRASPPDQPAGGRARDRDRRLGSHPGRAGTRHGRRSPPGAVLCSPARSGARSGRAHRCQRPGPNLWWQEPTEEDPRWALPEQSVPQRWHFDVWVPHDDGERRLRAVLEAGGRLVSDAAAPAYWVVEDADGNRSCICTPSGR